MSSMANSEPLSAAAHSSNSGEEIEYEVDSDTAIPIQEYFLVKLNRTPREKG